MFLFLKNYFLYQRIKISENTKTILIKVKNKKYLIFLKNIFKMQKPI
jgi:hypothetical protein